MKRLEGLVNSRVVLRAIAPAGGEADEHNEGVPADLVKWAEDSVGSWIADHEQDRRVIVKHKYTPLKRLTLDSVKALKELKLCRRILHRSSNITCFDKCS